MREINFPEQMYVASGDRSPFSTETSPLSFAIPYGTDAAFEKRKATVTNWVGPQVRNDFEKDENGAPIYDPVTKGYNTFQIDLGESIPLIFDNVPVEGFIFDKSVTRWANSNKWFRIQDPRGFTIEISAENLGDILNNSTIDHGKMVGKYLYGRKGAHNFLTREDHPEYLESLAPVENYIPVYGDRVNFFTSPESYYVGDYYEAKITKKTDYTNGWKYKGPEITYKLIKDDKKKAKIFQEIERPWSDGKKKFNTRKSFGKFEVVEKGCEYSDPPMIITADWYQVSFLFKTAKEIREFNPTEDEIKNLYETNWKA